MARRLLLVAFICALHATEAFAHDDEGDGGVVADAGLVEPRALETTVRTARLGRSASELVIPQNVLRAAPRSSAVDLLRLVPGLVASQHSGEGKAHQLFLRGFDAVHGQDVELNVAGLPVNEVSHLHALGYADLNWLIPDAVREVRVTEGTSRAWQGDFATAGTVRYELGLEEEGLTVATSAGSYGRARLFAGLRPFESKETFVAGEFLRGDGFGPRRAFDRWSLLGQAAIPLGALTLRVVAGSAMGHFESPGVVREDFFASGRAGFFDAFGAGQGGASSRHQALASLEYKRARSKTTIEAYGVWSSLTLRNDFTGYVRSPDGDGLQQDNRDLFGGLRLEHHHHFVLWAQPFNLDAGLGVRRDGIRQTQRPYLETTGALSDATIDADVVQNAANAWAELSTAPGRFRLMLGARADALNFEVSDRLGKRQHVSAFGVHLGLKAAAELKATEWLRFHASYGDGFRSPQARSLDDGEVAPFVSVRGAELGAALEFTKVVAKLAAFGSWVENDFFFDHTLGSTVYLGPSLRGGLSLVVTAQPVDGLVLSGSITGATAQLATTGSLLPSFAPLVGRLDASFTRPFVLGGQPLTGKVGTGLTFIGARPLPFGDVADPVFLADVRASVRWHALELVLDVQNLFDARWRDGAFTFASQWERSRFASQLPSLHFTAGAPRALFFTVEVHL